MAIREIRLEGDEILKKKSRIVEKVDDKIQELIDDMFETMYKSNGVGLSAVQVGVLRRVVVIDVSEDQSDPIVLINPVIIKEKGAKEVEEGCLSFPNKYAKVIRPEEVIVEAMDRDGTTRKIKAKDLLAQCITHELDHLEGVLFVEKMIPGTLEYYTPEQGK